MALLDIKLNVDPTELAPLCDKLRNYGYEESAIADLLGRWDISELNGKEYPNYIWRCERAKTPLAELVSIFLLGRASDRETVCGYLGEALVSAMLKCGILLEHNLIMVSHAVIYPCLGKFFLTDQWVGSGNQELGKVYELGTDSYVLARVTPRRGVKKALDLCTGSGLHAIFSADGSVDSKAVDINPRALDFTVVNAALNSVSVQTYLGDLYSVLEDGETFDLITANPPFVPSPDPDVLIHRSAGESGEEVPERLVAGLPSHLAPGGSFSMVLDHPQYQGESYLDRLERWIGSKKGWGIAVLGFRELSLGDYIMSHLSGVEKYDDTFQSYLESYLRLGIQSVRFANVFILRLEPDAPNWKVNQNCRWPNVDLRPQVEEWLQCLLTYSSPGWTPRPDWRPKLSGNYKCLWRDWHLARGLLELVDDNWLQPDPLNADESELLGRMKDQAHSIEELRSTWLEEGRDEESFLDALRGLGLRRALQ
jgi:Methyltransferase small domain